MIMKDKEWWKSKTIWTGAAMVIVGVADGIFGIELHVESVLPVLMGLMAIFLRQGISNQ